MRLKNGWQYRGIAIHGFWISAGGAGSYLPAALPPSLAVGHAEMTSCVDIYAHQANDGDFGHGEKPF